MSDRGQVLLDMQPTWRRNDQVVRALSNCAGDEFDGLDVAMDMLQATMHPIDAEDYLSIYETQLGISVENPGMTLTQRKNAVLAFMARSMITGSGADWERIANILIYSGAWSYSVGGTKNNVLSVNLPYPAGSIQAQLAEMLFRTITPAVMEIQVSESPGFFLDGDSLLDEDTL